MNNSAVFIIGPAGTGKTTFCKNMSKHFNTLGRRTCIFNLDPGISFGEYHFSIHNEWPISKVMQEYNLGPNGGMIKCLELCANDPHWLTDKIDGYNDEIMFIDCPGQIEIYIHDNSMKLIMERFKNSGYNVCCLYLIDSTFIRDSLKYLFFYFNL
jgi:GTPase SAR1 family protein